MAFEKRSLIPLVVIFDEYDVFFRDDNASDDMVKEYLDTLNVFLRATMCHHALLSHILRGFCLS